MARRIDRFSFAIARNVLVIEEIQSVVTAHVPDRGHGDY